MPACSRSPACSENAVSRSLKGKEGEEETGKIPATFRKQRNRANGVLAFSATFEILPAEVFTSPQAGEIRQWISWARRDLGGAA